MKISIEKLRGILVRPGYVAGADFNLAVQESKAKNKEIEDVLVYKDLIKDEQIGQLIAQDRGFAFVNLRREKIDEKTLKIIPEEVARARGIIAFFYDEKEIKAGMVNPEDLEMINIIKKRFGRTVKPFLITRRDLAETLVYYRPSLREEIKNIFNILNSESKKEEKDKLIVKIVDLFLEHGYNNKASDIHIEPQRENAAVRFRIDGVMHDILRVPKDLSELITARIKIMSKMRTDEHAAAQDGKFRFKASEEMVDVRVSIVPVTNGENIVMRLLSSRAREMSLEGLGLSERDFGVIKKFIKNPHGMILATGPTGSGKTTTLYEILKILNTSRVNIATIEDPVEYNIEGVSQIQVNPKTDLTFAKGLRAIVRQDPDIIMVGEIRDQETVRIAVNSAMTGHLVLSTMHANDAATALPRIIDMGIEPYLIVSTIKVIIAQRLLRKICEKCRYSYELSEEEILLIEDYPRLKEAINNKYGKDLHKLRFYKGSGCKTCSKTGYRGRIGVFEVLEMGESVKKLVVNRAPSDEIVRAAKGMGMATLLEDGVEKAINGLTTLEEVLRATGGVE